MLPYAIPFMGHARRLGSSCLPRTPMSWFIEGQSALLLQAPAKRPSRHDSTVHHRIYLPLAPGSSSQAEVDSDCCIQTPQSKATPGRHLVTQGEYQDKVQEVRAFLSLA